MRFGFISGGCEAFTLKLPVEPTPKLLDTLRRKLSERGGQISGNLNRGTITAPTPLGQMSASYRIDGQQLILTITDKPSLVSCERIERELRSALAQVPPEVVAEATAEVVRETVRPAAPPRPTDPIGPTEYVFADDVILVERKRRRIWPYVLAVAVVGGVMLWRRR